MNGRRAWLTAATLLVLPLGALGQTTWYVDDDGPIDPGSGEASAEGSAERPFDTIQEGIDAASGGDTVLVRDGVYTGNGNRDLDFGGKLITVRSENGPEHCIIDCQGTEEGPHRGFYFHNGETADAVVEGFTIANGWAGLGGGMLTSESGPTVTDCTFAGNHAAEGGGMCNRFSSPTLANCTFSGNTADLSGGGICNLWFTNLTVTNCTLAANAATHGAAVACDSYLQQYPSTVGMANCILWDGGDEIWNNDGSRITITYSDLQGGWPGRGNLDANPLFVDPQKGDYRLCASSPCIDAGDNAAVPRGVVNDLDGNPRFVDGPPTPDTGNVPIVDMGAYEFGVSCDLDVDCDVDIRDLRILLANYGRTTQVSYSDGDLDLDGDVDIRDVAELLGAYGTTCR